MYNIKFDNYESWSDWGLSLDSYTISSPEPHINIVSIPFSNDIIDLTEFNGEPTYKPRTVTFNFTMLDNGVPFMQRYTEILNILHGKRIKVVEPRDTEHYLDTRLTVGEVEKNNSTWHFAVEGTAKPYKYKNSTTIVNVTSTDVQTIVLFENEGLTTTPEFTTDANVQIVHGANSFAINEGTHKLMIVFKKGSNELKFLGNANVTVSYQEGVL